MKRLTIFFLVLLPVMMVAQTTQLRMYVDICRYFKSKTGEPFLQLYLGIPGNSIHFVKEADDQFQAKVEIQLTLESLKEGDTSLYKADRYNLGLPQEARLPDTTVESRRKGSLTNIQTLSLESGRYRLKAVAIDRNARQKAQDSVIYEFEIEALGTQDFGLSDIKWVAGEMPQKKGQRTTSRDDLIPMITNSTFINQDTLVFYQELYNAEKILEDKFMIRSVIYRGENRLWGTETSGQWRVPRYFNAYKESIDISQLGSGIYQMQVEILNQKNRPVQTHRETFYVYNSSKDAESDPALTTNSQEVDLFSKYPEGELDYYLRTFSHIATEQEANFVKALETIEQKKNFLYSFLDKRRKPEQQVLDLWNGHLAALSYTNQEFKSSFREGWQTDRGRVFLKYGIPNDVERYPSKSNLLPYELWRYNRLGQQTNVIFIFYDPDLATNEYPLLHSTKYGEENNPRWRSQLSNNGGPDGVDFERDRTNRFNSDLEIDR
jgi:GWxTD domain-containing protein